MGNSFVNTESKKRGIRLIKCFHIIMLRVHNNATHLTIEMTLIILAANPVEHLCAMHHSKHFILISSFNIYKIPSKKFYYYLHFIVKKLAQSSSLPWLGSRSKNVADREWIYQWSFNPQYISISCEQFLGSGHCQSLPMILFFSITPVMDSCFWFSKEVAFKVPREERESSNPTNTQEEALRVRKNTTCVVLGTQEKIKAKTVQSMFIHQLDSQANVAELGSTLLRA